MTLSWRELGDDERLTKAKKTSRFGCQETVSPENVDPGRGAKHTLPTTSLVVIIYHLKPVILLGSSHSQSVGLPFWLYGWLLLGGSS